jgi:hypothetical protein
VQTAKQGLEAFLSHAKKELGCSSLSYFNLNTTTKNRYQVEVPESKHVPR